MACLNGGGEDGGRVRPHPFSGEESAKALVDLAARNPDWQCSGRVTGPQPCWRVKPFIHLGTVLRTAILALSIPRLLRIVANSNDHDLQNPASSSVPEMADRYSFSLTTFSPRYVDSCAPCAEIVRLLICCSGKLVQIGRF